MKPSHLLLKLIGLFVIFFLLDSCSQATPTRPATQPGQQPTLAKAQPLQESSDTLPPGEESQSVSLTADTLQTLDSYRIEVSIRLQGKNSEGKDVKQTIQMLDEVYKSKQYRHHKIMDDNPDPDLSLGNAEVFGINQAVYYYDTKSGAPCEVSNTTEMPLDGIGLFAASDFFDNLELGEQLQQGVEVNGVKTDHYRIRSAYFVTGEPTMLKAETWLAQDGGFVVRFSGEAEGDFEILGDIATGKVTWEYNLSQINQPFELKLNPECQTAAKALEDFPIPANAIDKNLTSDLISFTSSDETAAIYEFYRNQFPAKGWKITSEDTSQLPMIFMTIEKDKVQMEVTITPGEKGGSAVIIMRSIED